MTILRHETPSRTHGHRSIDDQLVDAVKTICTPRPLPQPLSETGSRLVTDSNSPADVERDLLAALAAVQQDRQWHADWIECAAGACAALGGLTEAQLNGLELDAKDKAASGDTLQAIDYLDEALTAFRRGDFAYACEELCNSLEAGRHDLLTEEMC